MKVAVLGATGFTGEKIVEILVSHPEAEIVYLASRTPKATPYSSIFPRFLNKADINCETLNKEKATDLSDVVFLALPHTVSMQMVPFFLKKKKKVIDLSADYRLTSASEYKKYYKKAHRDKSNLKKAVYGLPELFEKKIRNASLIANPGCYPTSVIIPLYPLLKEIAGLKDIIVDSKSSITGAGRKALIEYHYSNISGNIWAYKPFNHQHMPEIESILRRVTAKSPNICFVPHVAGIEAGIYSTIYLRLQPGFKYKEKDFKTIYRKYYSASPFVRIKDELPVLKDVVGSNFCDIGFRIDSQKKTAVVACAIDNLFKGAAGTAVQNMNIIFGRNQTLGLV
ncbi:MAG: N-acetyl-gamma-glutamyl-phosphate reductase [Candidatus Omnitrophica bacterium]|nr:N-acetyl-gamma-glutamyl-phosphate reductase [Candidatus Omnitrophota bacterium]MBD3269311.1 N-acetyl-gamma-glutamyl-phosphate reductase [Candidatus Omnitrophota bacterium]